MSHVFKLYRLQQIDSQLDHAKERIAQINHLLVDTQALQQAEGLVNASTKQLEDAHRALTKAENEVKSQRLKIEETEATLYGGKVRNPKELQDLEKDVEALKRYLTVLEDRLLETMVNQEDAEAGLRRHTDEFQAIRSYTETQHSLLRAEISTLTKEIGRLEKERDPTVSTIDPADMKLYDQLRSQRKGVAVARVSDNACSACGSVLTPGMVQGAHSPTQIVRCTFCGRILYAG